MTSPRAGRGKNALQSLAESSRRKYLDTRSDAGQVNFYHQIVEDVGSNIDARNYLLIYQGFLEFVRLLVGFLDGEFLDLSQFAGECFVESLLCWRRSGRGLRLRPHQSRRHVLAQTGLTHQSRPQQLLDVGVVHVHLTRVETLQ